MITLAERHNKSPAQILIKWELQHDIVTIPKSVHKNRILENSNVFDFELSDKDMTELDSWNENLRFCPNPEEID